MKRIEVAVSCVLAAACVHRIDRKVGPTPSTIDRSAPYLKVHTLDGRLYVLTAWHTDDLRRVVTGGGTQLGVEREPIDSSPSYVIPYDDVALYETNTIVTSPAVAAMAVITGLSLAATVVCLTNTKACFGSCPTFYAPADDGRFVLQAEGFSDAIAPALETHDVDALARTTGRGGRFTLRMANEAYETHVVKAADLLVVARPPGGRVFAANDRLWRASSVVEPLRCTAEEGSCLDRVRALDGNERTSLTDRDDLAARETIELEFPRIAGRTGIAIGTRQSLVTTFLLYQGLAYLGTTAGDWLARLARGEAIARAGGKAMQRLVGGIEVQVERDGAWQTVGEVYETGPLAVDVHLIVLPEGSAGERVRLRLAKGGWRIDYVALAALDGEATPRRLAPIAIRGSLGSQYAAQREVAHGFPIVTLPGDGYELDYELPTGENYELFLDSRGYYLEWMRREWLREEHPWSTLRMLLDPAGALRDLAPAFKQLEPDAESVFWRSRYARP